MKKRNTEVLWGNTFLPAVLDAIGIGGDIEWVHLHFEHGMFATATFKRADREEKTLQLLHFGTGCISEALGAPKGLQAITLSVEKERFTLIDCRYAPIEAALEDVVLALKAKPAAQSTKFNVVLADQISALEI